VTKTNRVNVSAHQVAWNFAYCKSGGVSFFLVKALEQSNLYLFDGSRGRELAEHGLKSGRVGDHEPGSVRSGSGSVGSGSIISQEIGSGPGTMVPCLWSGSDQLGLQEFLIGYTRRRIGQPGPRDHRPGPGV